MKKIKFRYVYQHQETGRISVTVFDIEEIERGEVAKHIRAMGIAGFTLIMRQEFIGLHDKNGNEIYEGDIVRNTTEKRVFKGITGENGKSTYGYVNEILITDDTVVFVECLGHFSVTKRIERGWFEVLGNPWENPELEFPIPEEE